MKKHAISSQEPPEKPITGAVTFFDVLGWKGIWRNSSNPTDRLFELVENTKRKATEISKQYVDDTSDMRGREIETEVVSISDTIVLFTEAAAKIAIEIHAKIASWLLEEALLIEIPLRGAISYGEYYRKENIMVGYAVDEAASWHEFTDWIGVCLTPSAQWSIENENIESVIDYEKIPFKRNEKNLKKCVTWRFDDMETIYDIFRNKGPHTTEIASKYLNTLEFLDYVKKQRSNTNGTQKADQAGH